MRTPFRTLDISIDGVDITRNGSNLEIDGSQIAVTSDVPNIGGDGIDITGSTIAVDLATSLDYSTFEITGGTHDGSTWLKNGTASINDASPSASSTLTSGTYAFFYEEGTVSSCLVYNQSDSQYYVVVTVGADFSGSLPSDLTGYITSFAQGGTTDTLDGDTAPAEGTATSGGGTGDYAGTDNSYLEFASGELAVQVSTDSDWANDTAELATRATIQAYVDANSGAIAPWATVATATVGSNITLSGEQTIDGVLTSTSRVLVKDQTDASENGIYVTAAGAWARASGASLSADFQLAKTVFSTGGLLCSGCTFYQSSASDPVVDTDDITFALKSQTIIADGSITTSKLADDAVTGVKLADALAGDGLALSATELSVNVDDTGIEIATDTLRLKDLGVVKAKIEQAVQDQIDGAYVKSTNASAGSTEFTLDSVSVDDYDFVQWRVMALNGTAKESLTIVVQHDGDASTDATATDSSTFAVLGQSNIAGFAVDADLSGAGGSQVLRLRCSSTSDVAWECYREIM